MARRLWRGRLLSRWRGGDSSPARRHSSEGWNPVVPTARCCLRRHASLRWNDGLISRYGLNNHDLVHHRNPPRRQHCRAGPGHRRFHLQPLDAARQGSGDRAGLLHAGDGHARAAQARLPRDELLALLLGPWRAASARRRGRAHRLDVLADRRAGADPQLGHRERCQLQVSRWQRPAPGLRAHLFFGARSGCGRGLVRLAGRDVCEAPPSRAR